jgi:hypothetical protein
MEREKTATGTIEETLLLGILIVAPAREFRTYLKMEAIVQYLQFRPSRHSRAGGNPVIKALFLYWMPESAPYLIPGQARHDDSMNPAKLEF